MEALTVITSTLTIIWFGMYLKERNTRKRHDNYALAFLHGLKSRSTITSADWPHVVKQIDDTLERLQPSKKQRP
jgi:hypothetical protein